jgi:hypothetical protein
VPHEIVVVISENSRCFDLITCVHGLHYVCDKLGLIARAASWLVEDGRFVANLALDNLRFSGGSSSSPKEDDGRASSARLYHVRRSI